MIETALTSAVLLLVFFVFFLCEFVDRADS
jgi:hypothetical protein